MSYREVLGGDHLVWTVIEVVDGLDLSELYGRYVPDPAAGGRPAFDPAMMVSLLFFGYCEGKRTSRKLEEACRRDWAYRAICGGATPDHATIARFRQRMDDVLKSLFTQVLAVCAETGLLEVGLVALDGTKMGAAGSKEANKTAATLAKMEVEARRLLDEAAAADRHDDSGDDAAMVSRRSSVTRREAEQMRRLKRIGQAQQRVAEALETSQAEETKRGKPKRPVANVTDPESRLQNTRNGFIQGYNAQAVVTADQVVIATEVIAATTDVAMLEPMLAAAQRNLQIADVTDRVRVAVADSGYWSEDNAGTGAGLGIDLLIATTKSCHVGKQDPLDKATVARNCHRLEVIAALHLGEITARDAAKELEISTSYIYELRARYNRHGVLESDATLARLAMEHTLAQPVNRLLYRQRGWLIEGSFAHTKTHRGSDRFLRIGLKACNAEWNIINIAGNLKKLHRHHQRARQRCPRALSDPKTRFQRPITAIRASFQPSPATPPPKTVGIGNNPPQPPRRCHHR